MLLAAAGCKPREGQPPPAPSSSPAALARALGVDASMLVEGVDPPPAAGSLATEIASFVSLEACVKAHAAVDPLVADALHALGYRTFLMDACRILEAAHARSDAPCRRIDATGLEQECEAVVAMSEGERTFVRHGCRDPHARP